MRFRRARSQTPSSVRFFWPHRVPGRELSEFLSAYYLCAKANSPSFFTELTEVAQKLSEFSLPKQCSRNSAPPVSYAGRGRQVVCCVAHLPVVKICEFLSCMTWLKSTKTTQTVTNMGKDNPSHDVIEGRDILSQRQPQAPKIMRLRWGPGKTRVPHIT